MEVRSVGRCKKSPRIAAATTATSVSARRARLGGGVDVTKMIGCLLFPMLVIRGRLMWQTILSVLQTGRYARFMYV